MKTKNIKIRTGIFLAVLVTALAGWTILGLPYYKYAMKPVVEKSGFLCIPTGSTFEQEVELLVGNGFINDGATFRSYAHKYGYDTLIRPGRFRIDSAGTYKRLFFTLKKRAQSPVKVTFNNIRTFDQLAGRISRYIEADSASLMNTFRNDSIVLAMGFNHETFLGMFIPNTYEFYWNTSAEGFVRKMKTEDDRFWEKREEKRLATGLSRNEVMTLASIIFEETKYQPEMPTMAGVYINRLRIGMPLQADPTVKFAMGEFSLKRVLIKHLGTDSPYNTYKYAGLPPGPICIPEIAAVDAVLNYEKHAYLYFCADPGLTGKHRFAQTPGEHERNRAAYIDSINRKGIK